MYARQEVERGPGAPSHRGGVARAGLRHLCVIGPRASSPSGLLAPWVFWWNRIFHDFSQIFTGSWISAQKWDTRAILLKTVSVHVSCIQNTQIRGETIAKVFEKVDTFWTYQWSSINNQQRDLETHINSHIFIDDHIRWTMMSGFN
jgi:hypothetical protein